MQYTWLVATVTIKAGYTSTDVGAHTSSPILTEIFRTEGLKTKELQYKIHVNIKVLPTTTTIIKTPVMYKNKFHK